MKCRTIFLSCVFGMSQTLFSQNENTKWYFGHGAALDFTTNPPTTIAGSSMSVTGGCASVANSAGTLLFYTDARSIWNASNSVMANGTGLAGQTGDSQALIVRKPGSSTIYYVFTVDGGYSITGFNYSIVDMSLAAGLGSVTVKNATLYPNYCAQKLAGTLHNNGVDIWIVTHEMNSNNFRAHLLTSTGISTIGVISSVGTYYPPFQVTGHIKISPNGRKLGLCEAGSGSQQELYDFDNNTGIVSNPLVLPNSFGGWGQEFSPDGTKFYGTIYSNNQYYLCQWNLCAGSNSAIAASQVTILTGTNNLHSMQLAPNGKIYLARFQQSDLGVIHSPNTAGVGCNYVDVGFSLAPKYTWFSIPNFITSTTVNAMPNNLNIGGNTTLCIGHSITLTANGAANFTWSTGSTSNSIVVSSSSNTVFALSSNANPTCPLSYSTAVSVFQNPIVLTSGNSGICSGQSTTLTASGASLYQWSPGGNSQTIVISPTVNTTYTVVGTSTNGCIGTALPTVSVYPLPMVLAGVTSLMICAGNQVVFTGSGASTYVWSGGVNNNSPFFPLNSSTYTVTGIDLNNCSNTATTSVLVNQLPIVLASSTTSAVCVGNSVTLAGSGASTYTWTGGVINNAPFSPIATGIYTVTATDSNSCKNSATVIVIVNSLPLVSINSTTTTVCSGNSVSLVGAGAASYSWSGSVSNNLPFIPLTTNVYTVFGADINNCKNSATIEVVVLSLPVVTGSTQDSVICNGEIAFLYGHGAVSYTWNTGYVGGTLMVSPSITTTFSVTGEAINGCTLSVGIVQNVEQCLGLPETNTSRHEIYPNPNEGKFSLILQLTPQNASAEITDSFGRMLYEVALHDLRTEIVLKDVANGIYFLRITSSDSSSQCIKVNVQK
jgi:hypothetical protein